MGRKRRRRSSPLSVSSTKLDTSHLESLRVNPTISGTSFDLNAIAAKLGLHPSHGGSQAMPPQQRQEVTAPPTSEKSTAAVEKKLSVIDEWINVFTRNLELFPQSARSIMSIQKSGFQIVEAFSNFTVVGRYVGEGSNYKIYASPHNPPAGCSCERSDGKYACSHCFGFTQYLVEQLRKESELSRSIKEGGLKGGKVNWTDFRFDRTLEQLNKLQRFLKATAPEEEHGLAPVVVIKRERIAWEVSLYTDSPRVTAGTQPLNKRGDGWNKCKPCPAAYISNTVERTAGDKVALELIASSYSSYTSNVCTILTQLAGQSNVYAGEQVEVILFDACMQLHEEQSGWKCILQNRFCPNKQLNIFFAEDGLLAIAEESNRLFFSPLTSSQTRCMRELLNLPHASNPEHIAVLFERCQQLQKVVNIAFPNKFGQMVANQVKPVMLLRSRTDGFIDYGIRVRDMRSKLLLPGKGILVTPDTFQDQAVQWVRSFKDELDLVKKLHQTLELPSGDLESQLTFEQGLNLIERLEKKGDEIEVLWDKVSEAPIKSLGTISNKNFRVSIQQKRDWFQLNGLCELEGGNIQLRELLDTFSSESTENVGDYVRIGDRGWAKITDELKEGLQRLADAVNQERGQLKFDRTAALTMRELQGQLQMDATKPWQACLDRLANAEALEPEVPKNLRAELRDYQAAGFKWMRRLAEWGVGGVLADDMGLGKTVQTLAVLVDRAHLGPTLVIAPTSVGFNWLREAERFAPHLILHSYRETDRNEFFQELGPGHLVVCSYGLALRDISKLKKITWSNLVLDEAQAIKNSQSKTSQAVAEIEADWKIALTGTPVENHLGELWSLFRIISPGLFGGWEQFRKRFANPIERNRDEDRRLALRDRLKPFILRRTKKEVLRDLPARTESNVIVELSADERKLYDKYRLSILNQANEIAKLPDIKDQRFRLLALLTRLRQIACHPRLVEESWKDRSTKLEQLRETLTELRDEGHRTLIFSQFVQHLHLIREMLDEEKITYQYLDGSTPPASRQEQVDQFQNGDATAFLISLKAGGTGLNLTAADYVIHMDPWWNPAVEDQATDRAHRIGQTKPVMVYRLIAKNTVEEEILKLHEDKRDLIAGVLDGTHAASSLSTQELIELLTK